MTNKAVRRLIALPIARAIPFLILFVLAAILVLPDQGLAQAGEDLFKVCDGADAATADRISACNRVINEGLVSEGNILKAHMDLGWILADAGEYDGAMAHIAQAIKLRPDFAEIYYERSTIFDMRGDPKKAMADILLAIRLQPDNSSYFLARVELDMELGDLPATDADVTTGIKMFPATEGVFRGQLCRARATLSGDLVLALADCDRAVRALPGDPRILEMRGLVYLKLGRLEEAIADFDSSLASKQMQIPGSFFARGVAEGRLNDADGARADVNAALALDPQIETEFRAYGVSYEQGQSQPLPEPQRQPSEIGGQLFKSKCGVCHSAQAGQNRVGPSLAGVFGRKAGSAPGYLFSLAMQGSGLTWDAATLNAYLDDPRGKVPGSKSSFSGVPKLQDRRDIIAYLSTLN